LKWIEAKADLESSAEPESTIPVFSWINLETIIAIYRLLEIYSNLINLTPGIIAVDWFVWIAIIKSCLMISIERRVN